jgi:UDP-N-acetylmuramate: L-alanyl-gamma-D-glutamyl-meso-diaminopimelate ligase
VYYAKNINFGEITTFDIYKNGDKLGELKMQIIGRHNIENFVGAFALLYENEILNFAEIASGISSFKEVTRRLDVINTNQKIKIYEGFGSSYEKCRAAIEAIKDHFPQNKLKVIFEPYSFSWRRRVYLSYYENMFDGADLVYICDVKKDDPNDHDTLLFSEILSESQKNINAKELLSAEQVKDEAEPGDIFLLLTSGSLQGMLEKIKTEIDTL